MKKLPVKEARRRRIEATRKNRQERTNHCVYQICDGDGGVLYIGSCDDITDRKANHRYYCKNQERVDDSTQPILYQALLDLDGDWEICILDSGFKDKSSRVKREQEVIDNYLKSDCSQTLLNKQKATR